MVIGFTRFNASMYSDMLLPRSHGYTRYVQPNGRDHCPALSITDDMPESGCCGSVTDGVEVAASDDDDDGGDSDGEPARRSPHKKHVATFTPALLAFSPLSHYIGFGRSRIYALISQGEFPPPVKIGKSSRWVRAEIDTWLSKQIAARNSLSAG